MVAPESIAESDELLMPPRVWPRDALDWILCITVGILLTCALFGVPAVLVFFAIGSRAVALLTFCAAYMVFLSFSVQRVSLSPSGIRFHRVFGAPRFLPWETITSIAVAPRSEVVLRGWLWPPFPPRESTPSFSALEHFRIVWGGHCCYYPPKDPAAFREYVSAHLHHETI
jgi:hypothetical protein